MLIKFKVNIEEKFVKSARSLVFGAPPR